VFCTYCLYEAGATMTQVMRSNIFISNVVNVGFVLHVYVDVCPVVWQYTPLSSWNSLALVVSGHSVMAQQL